MKWWLTQLILDWSFSWLIDYSDVGINCFVDVWKQKKNEMKVAYYGGAFYARNLSVFISAISSLNLFSVYMQFYTLATQLRWCDMTNCTGISE